MPWPKIAHRSQKYLFWLNVALISKPPSVLSWKCSRNQWNNDLSWFNDNLFNTVASDHPVEMLTHSKRLHLLSELLLTHESWVSLMLHYFNQTSETAIAMAVRPEDTEKKRITTDTVAMPFPPQLGHITWCHQSHPFKKGPDSRKLSKIQNDEA